MSNGGSGVDKALRAVGAVRGEGGEGGGGLGTHKALGAVGKAEGGEQWGGWTNR